jgi:GNAT superfamily N-acetyltransferase
MHCQDLYVSAVFEWPRPATTHDVPALVALVESAYRGEPSRAGWTTEADLLDGQRIDAVMLAAQLAEPAVTVLQLDDTAGPLACAAVTDRGSGTSYFGMFAVRPALQGSGIGSWMLGCAQEHARAQGAVRMELAVLWMRTELIDWYLRRGYRSTDRRVPFPHGDPRFGRPRRADLEFVVLETSLAP